MEKKTQNYPIDPLRKAVEQSIGRAMVTPTDFNLLSAEVSSRSGGVDSISVSSLKRIWGYIDSDHRPSASVMSVLARFCGYRDISHFTEANVPESGFLINTPLTPDKLTPGDRIGLTWPPDRAVLLHYLGEADFAVEESRNAKLLPGDIASITMICRGYPLYATSIRRGSKVIPAYVAARQNGLLTITLNPTTTL